MPVVLLSHGQGYSNNLSSLNGYAPLANFWAAAGFVVIQSMHLSSRTLSRQVADVPGAPFVSDVPQLAGRIDCERIVAAGHSLGGHAAGLLLGARTVDPPFFPGADFSAPPSRSSPPPTCGGSSSSVTRRGRRPSGH